MTMNKRLYVGNLNYSSTEEELRGWFSDVGPVVETTIITDRETGRSKGFGFVEMETEEAAAQAIERLNGQELGGRPLTVAEAKPRRSRESSSSGWNRGGGFSSGSRF
jgi:RNA recognition motif-containing protein